jgi:hypothetical protein
MLISLSLLLLETRRQVALELARKHGLLIMAFTIPLTLSLVTYVTLTFPLAAKISVSISLTAQHISIGAQKWNPISHLGLRKKKI